MKYTLFITSFLLLFCSIAQAQLPTVEELVDSVEQNFHPIQQLNIRYDVENYVPSSGLEPPDSLESTREDGHIVYFYPDTTISIYGDTIITDTTTRIRIKHDKLAGNIKYERLIYFYSGPDTTLESDSGYEFRGEISDRQWWMAYSDQFPARLFFQFGEFLNNCNQVWVSGNPESDIYIISVYYMHIPGYETDLRRDYYIDYGRGTITQFKEYSHRTTPEQLLYEDVFSNFQQIEGIWIPLEETYNYFGNFSMNPPLKTVKVKHTFTLSVTP